MKVQVREISSKGPSSTVEWQDENGHMQRAIVPSALLIQEEGGTFVEDPHEGAPPGEDWEALIQPVDAARVAALLHQNGIWTYEDFTRNTPAVSGAFREAGADSYSQFVQAVHHRQSVQLERKE